MDPAMMREAGTTQKPMEIHKSLLFCMDWLVIMPIIVVIYGYMMALYYRYNITGW